MDRLLTKEERNEVFDTGETVGDERIAYCTAQDIKTRRITLQTVGQWLDDADYLHHQSTNLKRMICPICIRALVVTLLRGDMP